jgi:nucleoside-diphosphate-sugar epimerase
VRRFVAQSFAGWPYARDGGPVKSEDDPLDADPLPSMSATLKAIRHVESRVTAAGGIVLRYGGLYGPGTGVSRDGEQVELVRRRRFPVVGGGAGVWSFVHVDDAAAATVAALERGNPGAIYNVVDDDPAPVREWLPALAAAAGAKPPLRVPRWLGRLAAGPAVTRLMTEVPGASNAKAKRELGWQPAHPSWRDGFKEALLA